jgi:cytochrome c biogenesis protein CcdA
MENINFGLAFIVLGIIFLFTLFFSTLERFKKFFNILSWITGIALIILGVYYFFLR